MAILFLFILASVFWVHKHSRSSWSSAQGIGLLFPFPHSLICIIQIVALKILTTCSNMMTKSQSECRQRGLVKTILAAILKQSEILCISGRKGCHQWKFFQTNSMCGLRIDTLSIWADSQCSESRINACRYMQKRNNFVTPDSISSLLINFLWVSSFQERQFRKNRTPCHPYIPFLSLWEPSNIAAFYCSIWTVSHPE